MKTFILLFGLFILASVHASDQAGFIESSDGVKLYYEKTGSGQPLILIAGGPGDSHAYFKPYFKQLQKKFTVIYFDARGRGRSTRLTDFALYSVDKDVEDLESLRRTLGFEKVHLFGHSYGGIVAQSYALAHPNNVRRVILCNTFHSAVGWQNNIDNCNRHIQESYPDVWTRLMEMRKAMKSSATEWRALYDHCYATMYWYSVEKHKKHLSKYAAIQTSDDAFSEPVYYAIIGDDPDFEVGGSMKNLDLRPLIGQLKSPVLILTGRSDKVATTKQAFEIKELIPNAKIYIFEKSGHLPFAEENKSFTKVVRDFLNGNF